MASMSFWPNMELRDIQLQSYSKHSSYNEGILYTWTLHVHKIMDATHKTCPKGKCVAYLPGVQVKMIVFQRLQVTKILGLWSQEVLRVWFLEPETSNIGYLRPGKSQL